MAQNLDLAVWATSTATMGCVSETLGSAMVRTIAKINPMRRTVNLQHASPASFNANRKDASQDLGNAMEKMTVWMVVMKVLAGTQPAKKTSIGVPQALPPVYPQDGSAIISQTATMEAMKPTAPRQRLAR